MSARMAIFMAISVIQEMDLSSAPQPQLLQSAIAIEGVNAGTIAAASANASASERKSDFIGIILVR